MYRYKYSFQFAHHSSIAQHNMHTMQRVGTADDGRWAKNETKEVYCRPHDIRWTRRVKMCCVSCKPIFGARALVGRCARGDQITVAKKRLAQHHS